jgi:pyruvate carboxylase
LAKASHPPLSLCFSVSLEFELPLLTHSAIPCAKKDVLSHCMYPKVFEDFREFLSKYGDLSILPSQLSHFCNSWWDSHSDQSF